ncbi:hypothetical protein BGW38_010078 [Lunasporangiospora selenospora]|uniref:Acyl-protein thioesterase 1 n=1 Tax=Lunasporangiospora selenospora TaxID=979761 RepID=A0A9P6KFW1_9FUNG|nr:hypothetical protein BGW38_010078 [Lunasporangiospora selenospora]
MTTTTIKPLTTIIQEPTAKHTATVIILHGFGDSGAGWAPVGEQLGALLPHVKFIFPNAHALPITFSGGMLTPAWFDFRAISPSELEPDESGMFRARQQVMDIIHNEIEEHGIPSTRIIIGGFSQGCVLALLVGLTAEDRMAGIVALSGYIPLHEKIMTIVKDANRDTPIFWGHGDADPVVPYKYGELSVELLKKNNYNVKFYTYARMGHSASMQELRDLLEFLKGTVPENAPPARL